MEDKSLFFNLKVFQASIIYFLVLFLFLTGTFSIFLIFSNEEIIKLTMEDGVIEYLGFFSFLVASFFFYKSYKKTKNIYVLILSILMFIAAGEEISWLQRNIGYATPEAINKHNVQSEFNIHNLEIFNRTDFDKKEKKDISRIFEINFLFLLFSLTYFFFLPLVTTLIPKINKLIRKIDLPISPLVFGLFFIINWFCMKFLEKIGFHSIRHNIFEVVECNIAFMYATLAFYFSKNLESSILKKNKS